VNSSSTSSSSTGYYFNGADNNQIINSSSSVEGAARAIYLFSGNNNSFENFYVDGGIIRLFTSHNNTFNNLTGSVSGAGFTFDSVSTGNLIINSNITDAAFISFGASGAYNNTFQNSYLGDFTSITSSNWNNTPQFFYDNTYESGTIINGGCFDYPYNNTCESAAPPQGSSQTTSSGGVLPSFGTMSILLVCIILFFGLFL